MSLLISHEASMPQDAAKFTAVEIETETLPILGGGVRGLNDQSSQRNRLLELACGQRRLIDTAERSA
jgi:hypothetical protein